MNARGRERFVACEHAAENLALLLSADEEGDDRAGVQEREREGIARNERLPARLRHVHDGRRRLELGLPRKEGGGVPVGADAEQDEVEPLRQLDACRAQRMDLILRHRDFRQKRLAREALVRALVLGRHVALVAPPHVPAIPSKFLLRQLLVDGLDARAAREGDAELVAARAPCDPSGRELG